MFDDLFARFFKEASQEEREHAEKLMEYQVIAKDVVEVNCLLCS